MSCHNMGIRNLVRQRSKVDQPKTIRLRPRDATVNLAAQPQDNDPSSVGHIDFYGHYKPAGGVFVAGWLGHGMLAAGLHPYVAVAVFRNKTRLHCSLSLSNHREDLNGRGIGFLCFFQSAKKKTKRLITVSFATEGVGQPLFPTEGPLAEPELIRRLKTYPYLAATFGVLKEAWDGDSSDFIIKSGVRTKHTRSPVSEHLSVESMVTKKAQFHALADDASKHLSIAEFREAIKEKLVAKGHATARETTSRSKVESRTKPTATAEQAEKSSRRKLRHVFTPEELHDPKTIDQARDTLADIESARHAGLPVPPELREAGRRASALLRRVRQLNPA